MLSDGWLRDTLRSLDGKGYRGYKGVAGEYDLGDFRLVVDHVQGDPFADPSRMRVFLSAASAGLPPDLLETECRRTALADTLNRGLAAGLEAASEPQGSGASGVLRALVPGQVVLRRSAVTVSPQGAVEARFRVGLPARGRTILGRAAAELVTGRLPRVVQDTLRHRSLDAGRVRSHLLAVEDARALRDQLPERGLVSFVADGSILPRRSGVDDRPLLEGAVPFRSPPELRVVLRTPNSGEVEGMGVPRGVTLLVGGGFHGKSTLLRAIERGVYDHVRGDGRERVVTVPTAVKVRAEDGRSVAGTDISNFIGALPGGQDTAAFRTPNASGSTSQAAGIAEALEMGATCLLLDEDTSATNFLIRDARVQELIAKEDEPITPLIDRAADIRRELGVSVVLVVGGSGDYFDIADTVVAMRAYHPHDVTAQARALAERHPTRRRPEGAPWRRPAPRHPDPRSLDPRRGRRAVSIRAFETRRLQFGEAAVDVSGVEQLVEEAQLRAIGRALAWAREGWMDGAGTMPETLCGLVERLRVEGFDLMDARALGEYAEFRAFELAAVLNRLRGLRTVPGR